VACVEPRPPAAVSGLEWRHERPDGALPAASDQVLWGALLIGGGVALLAGLRIIERTPRWGAILVAVGAVAGALVIFWTVIVILVAVTLAVLAVVYARGLASPSTASDTRA
jgi:hypothetical protein